MPVVHGRKLLSVSPTFNLPGMCLTVLEMRIYQAHNRKRDKLKMESSCCRGETRISGVCTGGYVGLQASRWCLEITTDHHNTETTAPGEKGCFGRWILSGIMPY